MSRRCSSCCSSVCLSLCLSVCLSVYLSRFVSYISPRKVCERALIPPNKCPGHRVESLLKSLPLLISVCLCGHLWCSLSLSVCLFVCLSLSPYVCLSVCLSVSLFLFYILPRNVWERALMPPKRCPGHRVESLFKSLSVYLSVCLSLCLSFCLSFFLSLLKILPRNVCERDLMPPKRWPGHNVESLLLSSLSLSLSLFSPEYLTS